MTQNHSYFSTEFILTIISTLGTAWGTFHNLIPAPLASKIMIVLVLGYVICRSLVKGLAALAPFTKTDKDDKVVAALTQILDKLQGTFSLPDTPPAPPAPPAQ